MLLSIWLLASGAREEGSGSGIALLGAAAMMGAGGCTKDSWEGSTCSGDDYSKTEGRCYSS